MKKLYDWWRHKQSRCTDFWEVVKKDGNATTYRCTYCGKESTAVTQHFTIETRK